MNTPKEFRSSIKEKVASVSLKERVGPYEIKAKLKNNVDLESATSGIYESIQTYKKTGRFNTSHK